MSSEARGDAIAVERLSKSFVLGALQRDTMLRERLIGFLRAPLRRRSKPETLWALRDVSFRVAQGEVVGIVGRNGAGKSTLLKILSRITYPTSGRIRVSGRVAALLEVGTGFHEELTGRENIFLNGSILGMKRHEIKARLDAIVSFAGVERFVDTPIKRYSSGMRLRLGFAVAAHLDPDVLIVDEILAVGDAGFQKKCLDTMEGFRSGGRTVLFVSHNMAAVANLCTRGIWIDDGEIRQDGATHQVIESYLASFAGSEQSGADFSEIEGRRGSGEVRYRSLELRSSDGQLQNVTRSGDSLVLRFHYHAAQEIREPSFGFRMVSDVGTLITETSTWHHGIEIPSVPAGEGFIDLEIESLNLLPARYHFTLAITGVGNHLYDWLENCVRLDVEAGNIYGSGRISDDRYGLVFFPQRWRLHGQELSPFRVARLEG